MLAPRSDQPHEGEQIEVPPPFHQRCVPLEPCLGEILGLKHAPTHDVRRLRLQFANRAGDAHAHKAAAESGRQERAPEKLLFPDR